MTQELIQLLEEFIADSYKNSQSVWDGKGIEHEYLSLVAFLAWLKERERTGKL